MKRVSDFEFLDWSLIVVAVLGLLLCAICGCIDPFIDPVGDWVSFHNFHRHSDPKHLKEHEDWERLQDEWFEFWCGPWEEGQGGHD